MVEVRIDLIELAKELNRTGRHFDLAKAIRRAMSVSSAWGDLETVKEALNKIEEIEPRLHRDGRFERGSTGSIIDESLFVTAVIVYARATETSPKSGRDHWFGRMKLTAESREIHGLIMNLRNNEFAHFGRGMVLDGVDLLKETIVFVPSRPGISFQSSRVAAPPNFCAQFKALCVEVSSLAEKAMNLRHSEVVAILYKKAAADPKFESFTNSFSQQDERVGEVPSAPGAHSWTTIRF